MQSITPPRFFEMVWPKKLLTNETLELRLRRRSDDTIRREFATSITEFLKKAFDHSKEFDAYFGIATRLGNFSGRKKDCYRIGTVWADIDECEVDECHFQPVPDIMVNSGGGVHSYWLLDTPYLVRDQEHWNTIENLNKCAAHKFSSDQTAIDITRVLRVPGTYNHKFSPPRKVEAYAI